MLISYNVNVANKPGFIDVTNVIEDGSSGARVINYTAMEPSFASVWVITSRQTYLYLNGVLINSAASDGGQYVGCISLYLDTGDVLTSGSDAGYRYIILGLK